MAALVCGLVAVVAAIAGWIRHGGPRRSDGSAAGRMN